MFSVATKRLYTTVCPLVSRSIHLYVCHAFTFWASGYLAVVVVVIVVVVVFVVAVVVVVIDVVVVVVVSDKLTQMLYPIETSPGALMECYHHNGSWSVLVTGRPSRAVAVVPPS